MQEIMIDNFYYQELTGNPLRQPRERFKQYYQDLCEMENKPAVHDDSYLQGAQYSYIELIESILPKIAADGHLKSIELIIISFWSPEFDPDYSCGAYLCYRYQLNAKIVDISDCGFLAPFTALSAIQTYMQHSAISNALLLCLDQTTIPHQDLKNDKFPFRTSVCAMLMRKKINRNFQAKFIMAITLNDAFFGKFINDLFDRKIIDERVATLTINYDDIVSASHNSLARFKKIIYSSRQGNSVEKLCSLKILQNINTQKINEDHLLLVQDAAQGLWGVLIVRCSNYE